MSEWLDNQKKQSSNIHKLLEEQIDKTNPCRELTTEETKCLNKLEGMAVKLKRGEKIVQRTRFASLLWPKVYEVTSTEQGFSCIVKKTDASMELSHIDT